MMKNVAIVFNQLPHGSAKGREALDAALALSDINHITVFFIGDGVFHLLNNQQPEAILARNYIPTFGMLELYDVNELYVASEDLIEHGLVNAELIDALTITSRQHIVTLLASQDFVLNF